MIVAYQHHVGHAQKQPGAGDTGNGPQMLLELFRMRNGRDQAIENVIAVVRDEGDAVFLIKDRDYSRAC